jgi:hypothetical protein
MSGRRFVIFFSFFGPLQAPLPCFYTKPSVSGWCFHLPAMADLGGTMETPATFLIRWSCTTLACLIPAIIISPGHRAGRCATGRGHHNRVRITLNPALPLSAFFSNCRIGKLWIKEPRSKAPMKKVLASWGRCSMLMVAATIIRMAANP